MKKNTVRKGAIFAIILLLGLGALPLFAAEKPASKPIEKSALAEASTDLPDGKNVEKVLYTLNETLQENRRIRQSMRDLQEAFEKVTLEKSDLADQARKMELSASQRSKLSGQRIDELSGQLDASKKEIEKLQAGNTTSVEQKLEVEKRLEGIRAENLKMQELLKNAILVPERDQILARMKQNEESVRAAVAQVSSMDGENVALKQQLIQSYFDLGNIFYDLGRYEDAVVQYQHVLEWDPYHSWAHHNLAIIYDFHLHQSSQAIEHYQKYLLLKLPSEEAKEARLRLWDLQQLSKVTPGQPLKLDFDRNHKI